MWGSYQVITVFRGNSFLPAISCWWRNSTWMTWLAPFHPQQKKLLPWMPRFQIGIFIITGKGSPLSHWFPSIVVAEGVNVNIHGVEPFFGWHSILHLKQSLHKERPRFLYLKNIRASHLNTFYIHNFWKQTLGLFTKFLFF